MNKCADCENKKCKIKEAVMIITVDMYDNYFDWFSKAGCYDFLKKLWETCPISRMGK